MSMNIKNPEAHQLATELAQATGETLTAAVTEALRERLARVKAEQSREEKLKRIMAIAEECAKHMKEPWLSIDHGDLLYDEMGLPK